MGSYIKVLSKGLEKVLEPPAVDPEGCHGRKQLLGRIGGLFAGMRNTKLPKGPCRYMVDLMYSI